MKTLEKKIERIQSVKPTINDFLINQFDLEYAHEISSQYNLKIVKHDIDDTLLLDQFFNSVDFKGFSTFGFAFCEIQEYDDFYKIGSNEADFLISLKETKEIGILNYENWELTSLLAPNFGILLDLLPTLIMYDKIGYLGQDYTDELKLKTVNELKKILINEQYFSYFEEAIFG